MTYLAWLAGICVSFVVLERLRPLRRAQPCLRPGLLRDLGFLALNGHFFSVWTGALNGWIALRATEALGSIGLRAQGPLAEWPLAAQCFVLLVVADFLQWCVHNLLHRVPLLWTFHKVHHSITTMDFVGNFRFHWMESVVYRSLLWVPLALLGASGKAILIVAIVSTIWGDLNHSNLDVELGPLGLVLNSPRMHLWHHDQSTEGGASKNFGIVFSVWDYLFRTAYWPRDRAPERLGYPQMEEMPMTLHGQLLWPLTRRPS